MVTKNFQKIYSANGRLQAMAVQCILEKAGMPVDLMAPKGGAYLDILVPQESVFEATRVLNSVGSFFSNSCPNAV